jgi:FMN phosphatase YigB (HAD superfamily)
VVIEAVLLDVGGTLWPDRWTEATTDRADKVARLLALDPSLGDDNATALVDAIEAIPEPEVEGGPQNTSETIVAAIREHGIDAGHLDPVAIRRAISLPFDGRHKLLPGAAMMVRALHAEGMRLTVVSNTMFRDAECYWRDFAAAGLDTCLAAIVTSVDVGWRKPHPALFEAAVAATGVSPSRTAIVGNSETSDILPALDLGMIAVRVAIEEPPPIFSNADAVATSLEDVPTILKVS